MKPRARRDLERLQREQSERIERLRREDSEKRARDQAQADAQDEQTLACLARLDAAEAKEPEEREREIRGQLERGRARMAELSRGKSPEALAFQQARREAQREGGRGKAGRGQLVDADGRVRLFGITLLRVPPDNPDAMRLARNFAIGMRLLAGAKLPVDARDAKPCVELPEDLPPRLVREFERAVGCGLEEFVRESLGRVMVRQDVEK